MVLPMRDAAADAGGGVDLGASMTGVVLEATGSTGEWPEPESMRVRRLLLLLDSTAGRWVDRGMEVPRSLLDRVRLSPPVLEEDALVSRESR